MTYSKQSRQYFKGNGIGVMQVWPFLEMPIMQSALLGVPALFMNGRYRRRKTPSFCCAIFE